MGKEKLHDKFSKIKELEKQLKKEKKKTMMECFHQNEKGKLKIVPINDKGDYECKKCSDEFNMNQLKRATLNDAVKILHDAIQQIKCFSDPSEDRKLIAQLGELDYNTGELVELYDRVVIAYGNKNNRNKNDHRQHNKDNNDNSFGSYGSISFIGGKKKR